MTGFGEELSSKNNRYVINIFVDLHYFNDVLTHKIIKYNNNIIILSYLLSIFLARRYLPSKHCILIFSLSMIL